MPEIQYLYQRCPLYDKDAKSCCGAEHQQLRQRAEDYTVQLDYEDGRPSEVVHAFDVGKPGVNGIQWVSVKFESGELQEATSGKLLELTSEARDKVRNIHSGNLLTTMHGYCSFRK